VQVEQTAKQLKTDPREIYRREMENQGESRSQVSENDFRQWLRDRFSTDKNRKQVEDMLLEQRLRTGVEAAVKADDAALLASYDEVRVAAIPLEYTAQDKQSEEKTKAQIDKAEARLKKGEDFNRVAKSVVIGNNPVDPNQWQTRAHLGSDLEGPVFALAPGQFTAPIKLPSAYVIVKLLAKRRQLPADFEKNKESERSRLLKQLKRDAWQAFRADIIAKMPPDLLSPELIGLKLFDEAKYKDAAPKLEKALTDPQRLPGEVAASIAFILGLYHAGEKNWVKANEAFDAALAYGGNSTPQSNVTGYPYDIYMYLGKINMEQNKTQEALEYLALASGGQEYDLHLALLDIYQKMGEDAKAAEEEKWLDAWDKQQAQSKKEQAGQEKLINEAVKDVTSGRGGASRRAPAPTAPPTSK
jgi:tetratricopeptide (TPR) repeat protein